MKDLMSYLALFTLVGFSLLLLYLIWTAKEDNDD